MKKSALWITIILVIMIILISSFVYHILYFKNIQKNSDFAIEDEKQKALEILNKSVNLFGYEIKFGSTYILGNKKIVHVEITKEESKKRYSIDITNNRIVRG